MIALNTQFRVHVKRGDKFSARPVPVIGLREGFEGEPSSIGIVPDIGDSNRLIEVPAGDLAVCFDTCRICSNSGSSRPGNGANRGRHDH